MLKIAFIGGGNMAKAMITGFINSGVSPSSILCCTPRESSRVELANQFNINVAEKNAYAIHFADLILLAVKPNKVATVCRELNAEMAASGDNKLVVSMAAGIELKQLESYFPNNNRVALIMPNTPTEISKGVIGVYAGDTFSSEDRSLIADCLSKLGRLTWLRNDEEIANIVAAAGSAPAYFYLFIEAMISSSKKLGLSHRQATQVVLDTAQGAIAMAVEKNCDVKALREQVTSPSGTTAKAISSLQANNFEAIIYKAMLMAKDRALSQH